MVPQWITNFFTNLHATGQFILAGFMILAGLVLAGMVIIMLVKKFSRSNQGPEDSWVKIFLGALFAAVLIGGSIAVFTNMSTAATNTFNDLVR